jgi:hypothetical protein
MYRQNYDNSKEYDKLIKITYSNLKEKLNQLVEWTNDEIYDTNRYKKASRKANNLPYVKRITLTELYHHQSGLVFALEIIPDIREKSSGYSKIIFCFSTK